MPLSSLKFQFIDNGLFGTLKMTSSQMLIYLDNAKIGATLQCTAIDDGNPLNLKVGGTVYTVEEVSGVKQYKEHPNGNWISSIDTSSSGIYSSAKDRLSYADTNFPGFYEGKYGNAKLTEHARYIDVYHSPFNFVKTSPTNFFNCGSGYNPGLAGSGCAPLVIQRYIYSQEIDTVSPAGEGFSGWIISTQNWRASTTDCKFKITRLDSKGNPYPDNYMYERICPLNFLLVLQAFGSSGYNGSSGGNGGRGGGCGGALVLLVQCARVMDSDEFHPLLKFIKRGYWMHLYYYDRSSEDWVEIVSQFGWGGSSTTSVSYNKLNANFKGLGTVLGTESYGRFRIVDSFSDYTLRDSSNNVLSNEVYGSPGVPGNKVQSNGLGLCNYRADFGRGYVPYFSEGIPVASASEDSKKNIYAQDDGDYGIGSAKGKAGAGAGSGSLLGKGGKGGNSYDSIEGGKGWDGDVGAGGGGGGGGKTGGSAGAGGPPGIAFYW